MDRRTFLQSMAASAAGLELLDGLSVAEAQTRKHPLSSAVSGPPVSVEGCTLVSEFNSQSASWKVYEDLRTREGALIFVSSSGETLSLGKSAEASMAEGTPYLGLALRDIVTASSELLADRLLQNGYPDPEPVRTAAPSLASAEKNPRMWTTFVGTKEAYDVTPLYRAGGTRTYHAGQYFPRLREATEKGQIYDGLVGGWMPAVRKVITTASEGYWEIVLFGDVRPNKNKYIVQTWHRTARIEDGKFAEVVYGHSYPAFPPARQDPKPDEFYRALLEFAQYWQRLLGDCSPVSLPQHDWIDLSKHAFAKELMTRPAGVYPKYGAVDRDYAGSEYDGFQDIFTSAIYTNLEWGRFESARLFIDNYFTEYVDSKGMVNMRGPETAQFGLTLSLLARYFNYTRDSELILRNRAKIKATADLLAELHDESLRLPQNDPGYGLIHGWSESDACLAPDPKVWWQPYFAISAFARRGFKDIARAWQNLASPRVSTRSGSDGFVQTLRMNDEANEWLRRSKTL